MYQEIRVDTWDEFLQFAESHRGWAFRGQSNASWKLPSKLLRVLEARKIAKEAWEFLEIRGIRTFQRKAHHFLQHIPADDSILEWLSLMQHHGAPTRLIDITWSSYVAAYFAFETSETDCAIWAFDSPKIGYILPERGIACPNNGLSLFLDPDKQKLSIHDTGHGQMMPWGIADPHFMNQRLVAQSGAFLVLSDLIDATQIFEDLAHANPPLKKVVLPSAIRKQAMRDLYRMNIRASTLFPDLDGLGRSLSFELEVHWAFDPETLALHTGFQEDAVKGLLPESLFQISLSRS